MKPKRFFYHYNKPESHKQGRNVMTLHWEDTCHMVQKVICTAGTETHNQKRQPRCIIRGWATKVYFTQTGDRGDTRIAYVS